MIISLQDGYCHNTAAVCGARLSNYTTIPSGDKDALRIAIATKGPVAVAIDASHRSFSFYSYGVYYEKECGMSMDMIIVLNFEALNFCGLGSLDNFVDLYFHGVAT